MGVNMVGNCICDDEAVTEASFQEIIRRYYVARCSHIQGKWSPEVANKIEFIINSAKIDIKSRRAIEAAKLREEETGAPAAAIELPDGTVVTGKTSDLLGASSAMLLNALKYLAGIDDSAHLISREIIEPIQDLKVEHLGNKNPRLHTDEVLLALSICAVTDHQAEMAMQQLGKLTGCEVHSTVILSQVDENVFRKLGVNLTTEPKYQFQNLYHS